MLGIPHFLLGEAHGLEVNDPVVEDGIQGVPDSLGLFVNFFYHEMLESGLFRRLGVPGDLHQVLLNFVAVQVEERHFALLQPGQFQIADVIHVPGVFQNGRHVGGQVAFPVGNADDHGAVLPGGINFLRVVLEHQGQGVGPTHPDHGVVDGIHGGVGILFVVIIHQFDGHFRVRAGIEGVALPQELFLQLLIIFNDAVMDADNKSVVTFVGMGVQLAGFAVGGPAGVTHAAGAGHGGPLLRLVRQNLQPALGLDDHGRAVLLLHRQARRVIPAIFQF